MPSAVVFALTVVVGLVAGLGPVASQTGTEAALTGIKDIRAGNIHSCALQPNGQVRCWGLNDDGQVGDGSFDNRPLPTVVSSPTGNGPLTGVTQISTGFHTCARLGNGKAVCWGANHSGQIGDGTTADQPRPRNVTVPSGQHLTGVAQVEAGDGFACARMTNGHVRCWGENGDGRLGIGSFAERHRSVAVVVPGGQPLTGVTQLSVGRSHACARLGDGRARCWGHNFDGAVGDGTRTDRRRAVLVQTRTGPLAGVTQISAGDEHSCARLASGQLRCWGYNGNGQLGLGDDTRRLRPQLVRNPTDTAPLGGVADVSASQAFTCARLSNGQGRCWGSNGDGNLGDGTDDPRDLPVVVRNATDSGPLVGILRLSAGGAHTCAKLLGGEAWCWGDNFLGQLGSPGAGTESFLPVAVQT